MGFGSAFTSAWNKASDAVQQKVAQVATTAHKAAEKAVDKAVAAKDFIAGQAAKAQQAAQKALPAVKKAVVQAVEKAKKNVLAAAGKAADAAKKKAETTAQNAKEAFRGIKKKFDHLRRVGGPLENCPYWSPEGTPTDGSLEAALCKLKLSSYEAALVYGKVESRATSLAAEVGVFKDSMTLYSKGDPLNPSEKWILEGSALTAGVGVDRFVGSDEKKAGVKLGARATADVASLTLIRERNTRIPFTDWTIRRTESVEVGLGVGGSAGVHAFWNKEEKRFHMGGFLTGGPLGPFGAGSNISIGKKYK